MWITIFQHFGMLIFTTVASSLIHALFVFPVVLMYLGPVGRWGDVRYGLRWLRSKLTGKPLEDSQAEKSAVALTAEKSAVELTVEKPPMDQSKATVTLEATHDAGKEQAGNFAM
eukprot:g83319.t1